MTTTGDLVGRMIPRPPDSPCGRVFRLDVLMKGEEGRLQYADGVIAPDGCALARVRDTGTVVSAPGGIEDLVATMGDPRIRVVYRYEDGTV